MGGQELGLRRFMPVECDVLDFFAPLIGHDGLVDGPCLAFCPPRSRTSYTWAHAQRSASDWLHTYLSTCTCSATCTVSLPAAIATRCSRASGSFHCQGWRGEHQGYVRRAGRRASRSASTVVTAASQWQPAVTDEVSASELCWKWSRMKSQLLSSGWQRTSWVLKSKSQLPEQPKKNKLNTSMRTAV